MYYCRAVVMEDDPLISFHLRIQLATLKVRNVHFFETRSQSLQYLNRQKVDLIITNLRLLDGWLTSCDLKEIASLCNHMLILTGIRDELSQNLSTKTSFSYLYKPYNLYQLKKSILAL